LKKVKTIKGLRKHLETLDTSLTELGLLAAQLPQEAFRADAVSMDFVELHDALHALYVTFSLSHRNGVAHRQG
jgi:hypothetical protein